MYIRLILNSGWNFVRVAISYPIIESLTLFTGMNEPQRDSSVNASDIEINFISERHRFATKYI